jgi:hypothetical protein
MSVSLSRKTDSQPHYVQSIRPRDPYTIESKYTLSTHMIASLSSPPHPYSRIRCAANLCLAWELQRCAYKNPRCFCIWPTITPKLSSRSKEPRKDGWVFLFLEKQTFYRVMSGPFVGGYMYDSKSYTARLMISTLHTRLHPFRKLTIHPVMSVSGPAFPGTNISIKTTDYFDLNSFSSSFTYLLYQKNTKSTSHERVSLFSKIPTKCQQCPLPPDKHFIYKNPKKTRDRHMSLSSLLRSTSSHLPKTIIDRPCPIRKHTRSKNRATTILWALPSQSPKKENEKHNAC